MTSLLNKTAIITGASSGIGYEAAKLFAREGANIVAVGRRGQVLDKLVAEIHAAGGKAVAVVGDVKDESCAKKSVDVAVDKFGGLDIGFNNAGILGAMGNLSDISLADWNETIQTNLTSAFLCAKYQIPAMLKRGNTSLIFTSSFVGYTIGMPGMAAYAASKAGIIGLTKVLAAEYSAQGIRVNALLPGGTKTEMSADYSPEQIAFFESIHAMKRLATPLEIAKSALYLASDASSFTTGTALLVEGGVSITKT
ncbi:MAG: SDR family oxidoreductase [Glaciimonas sp.]|nr:SDR family oxidoreductase [Glaciimonas sp.]